MYINVQIAVIQRNQGVNRRNVLNAAGRRPLKRRRSDDIVSKALLCLIPSNKVLRFCLCQASYRLWR